ncbi:hypothetical protein [Actinomadura rifamycini]|uniref:hypothetical protein n=1 Tax=Actinomadura rifamycini TaxID=31962 RepID=UPI000420261F|nr:hypothetical protein [Actinomadura rifamycini]
MAAGFVLTATALVFAGTAATAAGSFPDPAPGGPMRPHEPDVTGPRNLDGITARATRNAGRSVTVAFDRRSRTAQDTVPAAARRFVFLFDRSITFTPEALPTCARTTIDAEGVQAGPPGSRVGFAETTARPGARLRFGLWSEFVTGQIALPTDTATLR